MSEGDDTAPRSPAETAYLQAALGASVIAAEVLAAMEQVAEQLAPERSRALAAEVGTRFSAAVDGAAAALAAAPAPPALAGFAEHLDPAFADTRECVRLFTSFPIAPPAERIPRILAALHHHAQAQERFYALRRVLPPFRTYWGPGPPDATAAAPAPSLVRVSAGGHHGGFALLVPDGYDEARTWPLIVALHGGSGNGRDFLWTWVREANLRGYLLVAPSSAGSTWDEGDAEGLLEILGWLAARYRVDRARILLTGLSDGGTFALVYGLARPDVFRALAPCCGVFHPVSLTNGNLQRARGVPIYLVHGAKDFLFPVEYAQMARTLLTDAGADLTYRELPELSHTYPRSENLPILDWFERTTRPRAG